MCGKNKSMQTKIKRIEKICKYYKKKKHVKKLIIFFKFKKKSETLRQKGA